MQVIRPCARVNVRLLWWELGIWVLSFTGNFYAGCLKGIKLVHRRGIHLTKEQTSSMPIGEKVMYADELGK